MKYLTVGTLWKDEHTYAWDFIKFHRNIGVEQFIIFDEEYYQTHEMFKNEKDIEVIKFSLSPKNIHQEAFSQLIKYNQNKTKWLALIDADQSLVPVKTDNVCDFLQDYEDFASVQLNWKAFGSSYQEKRLPGSVYERFTLCAPINSQYNYPTQFICQPSRTLPIRLEEPHYPLLPPGEISVNTDKKEIIINKIVAMNPNTPRSFNVPVLWDKLYVDHFTNKSKEEFLFKNNRGRADIFGAKMPITQFEEYDKECNQEKEFRTLELWNKVKKL